MDNGSSSRRRLNEAGSSVNYKGIRTTKEPARNVRKANILQVLAIAGFYVVLLLLLAISEFFQISGQWFSFILFFVFSYISIVVYLTHLEMRSIRRGSKKAAQGILFILMAVVIGVFCLLFIEKILSFPTNAFFYIWFIVVATGSTLVIFDRILIALHIKN